MNAWYIFVSREIILEYIRRQLRQLKMGDTSKSKLLQNGMLRRVE